MYNGCCRYCGQDARSIEAILGIVGRVLKVLWVQMYFGLSCLKESGGRSIVNADVVDVAGSGIRSVVEAVDILDIVLQMCTF